MESDRFPAVFGACFQALMLIVLVVVVIVINCRASTGRLARNGTVGIRVPSTMRSDEAWVAGHRAARRLNSLVLLNCLVACGLLIISLIYRWPFGVVNMIGGGGVFILIVILVLMAVVAGRAAKGIEKGEP